jgi:hypothetical protein
MVKEIVGCLRRRVMRAMSKAWAQVWLATQSMPRWVGAVVMVAITLLLMPIAMVAAMIEAGLKEACLWLRELRSWMLTTYGKGGE